MIPNLDGQTDLPDVCFIYPKNVIDEFRKKAKQHKDDNGLQKELLAFVAGYKDGEVLIGTELIFPKQSGTTYSTDDEGKVLRFYVSYNEKWINIFIQIKLFFID